MKSRQAYEIWHDKIGSDQPVADTPWHRLVAAHLDPQRDLIAKRVLEIGCGRGGFTCWLALNSPQPAPKITAVDYALTATKKARALACTLGCTRITWAAGDIQALAFRAESFDTAISCETIEHVAQPHIAVRELARVLKPGGRLFLTTPNYLGSMGLYRFYLRLSSRRFSEVGQPINRFTILPMTKAWVSQAGLSVITVDAVGHYVPIPGRPPFRLKSLDRFGFLTRWAALHSLVVAVKPWLEPR